MYCSIPFSGICTYKKRAHTLSAILAQSHIINNEKDSLLFHCLLISRSAAAAIKVRLFSCCSHTWGGLIFCSACFLSAAARTEKNLGGRIHPQSAFAPFGKLECNATGVQVRFQVLNPQSGVCNQIIIPLLLLTF